MGYSIINAISSANVPSWGNAQQYIAVHYLGVDGQSHTIASDGSGAHYYIYWDGTIYQAASHDAILWQVGTAGCYTQKHAYARNANCIGIEMCCHCDGNASSAEDPYWYFTEETQNACVWLVQKLMNDLGIPADHVLRHYDVVNKTCPAPYVHNNGYKTSWTWDQFMAKVKGESVEDEQYYRIRLSWDDPDSQVGAYKYDNLEGAISVCPEGYSVYDENGVAVYTNNGSGSTTIDTSSGEVSDKKIYAYFKSKGMNDYGVAGLMGNMYAESGMKANNLQDSGNTKLGLTDEEYTAQVDSGIYTNFVNDGFGYGLVQYTHPVRKSEFLDVMHSCGVSIGNKRYQVKYIYKEIKRDYSSLLNTLKNATSVLEASNAVLTQYEQPADQSASVQSLRASYGQTYYDKYAGTDGDDNLGNDTPDTSSNTIDTADYYDVKLKGKYTVTASSLYLRSGANENKTALTKIPNGGTVQCYGYYSTTNNVNWLLVEYVDGSTTYTGFVCSTYLNSGDEASGTSESAPLYYIKVSTSDLNIRTGPGTNYATNGKTGIGTFGITEEKTGQVNSGTGTYGKLLSGSGWVWVEASHVAKI